MSSASQTQAEAQIDPLDTDDNEADEADVAQLRAQIRTLTQGRKDDQDTLKLILEQLATLAAAQVAQQNPVRSIKRDSSNTSNLEFQDWTP